MLFLFWTDEGNQGYRMSLACKGPENMPRFYLWPGIRRKRYDLGKEQDFHNGMIKLCHRVHTVSEKENSMNSVISVAKLSELKNLLQVQAQGHHVQIRTQFLFCLIVPIGDQETNTPNQQFQQTHDKEQ